MMAYSPLSTEGENDMNNRFWMIGLLIIMAVVCSTALALVNVKIAPIIQKNNEIKYMSTVLDVFGIPYDSKTATPLYQRTNRRLRNVKRTVSGFSQIKKAGAPQPR